MYMEHWKMKESSLSESEASKVSGTRGLMALFVGLKAEMSESLFANSSREWARFRVGGKGLGAWERAELAAD